MYVHKRYFVPPVCIDCHECLCICDEQLPIYICVIFSVISSLVGT